MPPSAAEFATIVEDSMVTSVSEAAMAPPSPPGQAFAESVEEVSETRGLSGGSGCPAALKRLTMPVAAMAPPETAATLAVSDVSVAVRRGGASMEYLRAVTEEQKRGNVVEER